MSYVEYLILFSNASNDIISFVIDEYYPLQEYDDRNIGAVASEVTGDDNIDGCGKLGVTMV